MLIISVLGDNFRRLRRRGIVLLTLANTFLKRFSFAVLKFIKTSVPFLKKGLIIIIINDSQKSICRFLWFIIEITFLNWDLNWYSFFIGNSNHFKKKSPCNSFAKLFTSWTTEKNYVSSEKGFVLKDKLSHLC